MRTSDTWPSRSTRFIVRRSWVSGRFVPCSRSAIALIGHRLTRITAVPTAPMTYSPAPAAMPTADVAHRLAAVVSPRITMPSLRIAPAPRKPMPETIWAAMRVGSTGAAGRLPSEAVDRQHREQGGPERDEHVGPQARRVPVDLALEPDREAEPAAIRSRADRSSWSARSITREAYSRTRWPGASWPALEHAPSGLPSQRPVIDRAIGCRGMSSTKFGVWLAFAGAVAVGAALAIGELHRGPLRGVPSPLLAVARFIVDIQPPGAKELVVALFGEADKARVPGLHRARRARRRGGARPARAAAAGRSRRRSSSRSSGAGFLASLREPGVGRDPRRRRGGHRGARRIFLLAGSSRLAPRRPAARRRRAWRRAAEHARLEPPLPAPGRAARSPSGRSRRGSARPAPAREAARAGAASAGGPPVAAAAGPPAIRRGHRHHGSRGRRPLAHRRPERRLLPHRHRVHRRRRWTATRWRLQVTGLVDRPVELTYDELIALPIIEQYVTIACVSNEVGGDLVGNAKWTGVALRDVLDDGRRPGRTRTSWWAARSTASPPACRSTWVMDPARAPMIAVGDERRAAAARPRLPGPADHPGPVRLRLGDEVAGRAGADPVRRSSRGSGSRAAGPRRRRSSPSRASTFRRHGATVAAGRTPIAGVAWAPDRGISAVEVNIDGGGLGAGASCRRRSRSATWVQWLFDWDADAGHAQRSRFGPPTAPARSRPNRARRPRRTARAATTAST